MPGISAKRRVWACNTAEQALINLRLRFPPNSIDCHKVITVLSCKIQSSVKNVNGVNASKICFLQAALQVKKSFLHLLSAVEL